VITFCSLSLPICIILNIREVSGMICMEERVDFK